ncbi:MAG: GPW/gp25 family protein [Dehalococcoidia bacterium]
MNDVSDFIGRGWTFPVRFTARGGIALTSGTEEVDAALRMILSTAHGERVMRPDFGCRIWDLLFHPLDANTIGQMEQAVRDAVGQWEPRVDLEGVRAVPDEEDVGLVHIEIAYRLRATNDRRNLVYPFYVIPREGEP